MMNEEQNAIPASEQFCRLLRCKEMFIPTGELFNMRDSGSGIYWCSHTQNCLGPDGEICGPDYCQPGRSCHETL